MQRDVIIVGGGPAGLYAVWRLAEQARAAGVQFSFGARITSLEPTGRDVIARAEGLSVRARLAMVATGASYMLQRRFGLGLPRAYLHTAQRELPAGDVGEVE